MKIADVAIIIATKDRPKILAETLRSIKRQTRRAGGVSMLASALLHDAPPGNSTEGVVVLVGPPGGSAQRNTAIRQVPLDVQYVAFFDDDMELHPSYLENAVSFLEKNSDVVAVSGTMIADGNISREAARALLEQDTAWTGDVFPERPGTSSHSLCLQRGRQKRTLAENAVRRKSAALQLWRRL